MPASVRRVARAFVAVPLLALGIALPVASAAASQGGAGSSQRVASLGSEAVAVTPAAAGAGWIARSMAANGAVTDSYSHIASAGDTANAVVALVSAGVGANQVKAGIQWLEANFASFVSAKGVDNPGRLGEVILAAVAAGADPLHFGGRTKSDNLVARLEKTEKLSGSAAGSFGAGVDLNAFNQSLALLALGASKNLGRGTRLGAAFLSGLQCTDGGWEYSRITTTAPCAKPNPKNYSSPDTNTTAIAVMALLEVGGHIGHSPLGFFEGSQEANGSFALYGIAAGQQGDPNSTAYVIQALVALHALANASFVRGSTTPEQALARFQLGCKAPSIQRGEFSAYGAPSQLATLQAVPALAGVTLPVARRARCQPLSLGSAVVHPEPRSTAAVTLTAAAVLAALFSGASLAFLPASGANAQMSRATPGICPISTRVAKGRFVVAVVIDFGGPNARVIVSCVAAESGETGAQVLQAQAAALSYPEPRYASSGLLCGIDGYPANGCGAEAGGHYAYWSYWHGGKHWQYADNGPAGWTVTRGDVEGWRFEPDGSASPSDSPPRASSSAPQLESQLKSPSASSTRSAGKGAGPVAAAGSSSDTRQVLFGGTVALIVLLGAGALVRSRRARTHLT